MTVLRRWRTARKLHRCTFCSHAIMPGTRYVSFSLTPHDGDIGNVRWMRAAGHGEDGLACEAYWDADPYTPLTELIGGVLEDS